MNTPIGNCHFCGMTIIVGDPCNWLESEKALVCENCMELVNEEAE